MKIRPMVESDLNFAASCTAAEGWTSEIRTEFETFFGHSPAGCLIAEDGDHPVGIGIATSYGSVGFIGELIVLPENRGQGVGRLLLDYAIDYLRGCGAHSIYLDGVVKAVPLYERAGFRKICRSLRFYGMITGREHALVHPLRREDLDSVCALDQAAFGADRRYFLERRLMLYPDLCKMIEQDGQIAGYIFGRRAPGSVSFGPWFLSPDVSQPEALIESAALAANGERLGLGVLETNVEAIELIKSVGLQERPLCPWRMVLGSWDKLGADSRLYAVGSPAKG